MCRIHAVPFVVTSVIVASHGDIYFTKTLWTLFYLALPVHSLVAAVTVSSALAGFNTDKAKIALAIAFTLTCVTGIYKVKHLHRVACEEQIKTIIDDPSWRGYGCGMNPVFPYTGFTAPSSAPSQPTACRLQQSMREGRLSWAPRSRTRRLQAT